ncbi:MAG: hypothetical protein J0L97_01175 [Alphaproteobacteria bacterium]|nr:hypothetical protein [Alphaproteobacteria bacterium]
MPGFISGGLIPEKEPEEAAPPPPPTFSEQEMEKAKADAFLAGYQKAVMEKEQEIARVREGVESMISAQLGEIMQQLALMLAERKHLKLASAEKTVSLLKGLLEKACTRTMRQGSLALLETHLSECLGHAFGQAKIKIIVHPTILRPMSVHLDSIRADLGEEVQLSVQEDGELAIGDVRVEWDQGHAEYSAEALRQSLEKVIEKIDFQFLFETGNVDGAKPERVRHFGS